MELTVNVTDNSDGGGNGLNVGLFDEELLHEFTGIAEVSLGEALAVIELGEPDVDICFSTHLFWFKINNYNSLTFTHSLIKQMEPI